MDVSITQEHVDDELTPLRSNPRPVPRGSDRLRWYAPALLWMVSSVGSGAVLFTPRVASRYGYELLWLALVVCWFMWIMIREAARYTTVTGRTLLDGFSRLPGPRGWALWVIFVPQLLAAVVGVAGLCALVGSALSVALPGPLWVWTLSFLVLSTAVVVLGQYDAVERVSLALAAVLVVLALVAAIQVLDDPTEVARSLRPSVPDDLDVRFVLPWIGTILAGSMGIVWYAYWTGTRGFGGRTALSAEHRERGPDRHPPDHDDRLVRLDRWMTLLSRTAGVAVATGALVIVAFTVLGAELLAPRGLVPEGADVAGDLATLLEGVWGTAGFWTLIVLTVFGLGGSVMANQDGWSRSFADISLLLVGEERRPVGVTRRRLQRGFALVVTGAIPAVVFLAVGDPVTIMSASGVVAAVHTPFIVALILLVTHRELPAPARPRWTATALLAVSGGFYLVTSVMRLIA